MGKYCIIFIISFAYFLPLISLAEDKIQVPEYFFAPEGPFKNKEEYKKAISEQDSRAWRHVSLPVSRPNVMYDVCQEDLKRSNDDIEKFLSTKCGLLMQGYVNASETMFYLLTGAAGKDLALKVAKRKPYCLTEDINIIDMAKIFVSYVQKNPEKMSGIDKDKQSGGWLIFLAMNDKYPCPHFIEENNK